MSQDYQFELPEEIREDTANYKKHVADFIDDKISNTRFKGYRVPMGVYGQRGEENKDKYMVRVRIPGGYINRKQLKLLAELSDEYGAGYLHFTTRQDIQLHRIDIDDTPDILDKLLVQEYGELNCNDCKEL